MLSLHMTGEERFIFEAGTTNVANGSFLLKKLEVEKLKLHWIALQAHLLHSFFSMSITDMMFHLIVVYIPFIAISATVLGVILFHVLQAIELRLIDVGTKYT